MKTSFLNTPPPAYSKAWGRITKVHLLWHKTCIGRKKEIDILIGKVGNAKDVICIEHVIPLPLITVKSPE